MSQFKLSASLKITVAEAEALMADFFNAFPAIHKTLTDIGGYGVQMGYIKTPAPFFRKRWFPEWVRLKPYIQEHLAGIKYNKGLGSIERAAKNTPIQGGSGDMTKLAMVKIRRFINDGKLRHKVRISMQIHDEILTEVKEDYAQEWAIRLKLLMEEAAKVIIPSGLLKADPSISKVWTKG